MKEKTKSELIYKNGQALTEVGENLEYGRLKLQDIVNEYFKIVEKPLSIRELQKWFGQNQSNFLVVNKEVVKNQIYSLLYYALQAKHPDFAFNMENIPEQNLSKLFEVANELAYIGMVAYRDVLYWDAYEIKDRMVNIIPGEKEKILNQFQFYAETEPELSRLEIAQQICVLLSKVRGDSIRPQKLNIPNVAQFDPILDKYRPSEIYVKFNKFD